jgi:hypothetical protein
MPEIASPRFQSKYLLLSTGQALRIPCLIGGYDHPNAGLLNNVPSGYPTLIVCGGIVSSREKDFADTVT